MNILLQVMKRSAVNEWLQRFRKGNLSVEEGQRNGRPPLELDDRVGIEVETDPYITCVDIACRLKMPWTRVRVYLHKRDIINVSGMWVKMTDELRQSRIEYCKQMIENHSDLSYWDSFIFEGERIIYYNKDVGNDRSLKDNLRSFNYEYANVKMKATRLRLWWTTGGYFRFKYTPVAATDKDTAAQQEQYSQQLKELYEDMEVHGLVDEGRHWVLHKNSINPQTAPDDILASFGWSTMLHPPHCPDISPTDYHVVLKFLSTLNSNISSFTEIQQIEEFTQRTFDRKKDTSNYYRRPITILTEKWHRVIETEGEFIATHEKVD